MNEYKNWQKLVSRKAAVLPAQNIMMGYITALFKDLLEIDCTFSKFCYVNYEAYVPKKDFFTFVKKVQDRVNRDPEFIRWVIKENYKYCNKLLAVAEIDKEILKKKSNKELQLLLKNYLKGFYNMGPFWAVPFAIEKIGTEIISKQLRERLGPGDKSKFDDYFLLLTSPLKESYVGEEQRELLQLAKEILIQGYSLKSSTLKSDLKKNKQLWGKLANHTSKYSWLSIQYMIGDPWTLDDFLLRLRDIKTPESVLKNRLRDKNRLERRIKLLIKKLGLPNETIGIIQSVREYVFLRTYRKDITTLADFNIRPLLIEVGRRFNLSFDDMIFHTSREILELLDAGSKLKKIAIEKRRKNFAILASKKKTEVLMGKELEEFRRLWGGEVVEEDVKIIEGTTACKGKEEGRVRTIVDKKEFLKFEKGEVLVTTMTTPDFVPIMKKAVAIVTDEGGILCHAAIISREFNLPCIVGTRQATKVLKNGDLVEVDADRGIIKIIK